MNAPARPAAQRLADTIAKLETPGIDVWVASAGPGPDGPRAHLVPVSMAWLDDHVVIAIPAESPTARNIVDGRRARLALGPTRDVVVVDVVLDEATPVEEAPPALADRYAAQADWDPRATGGGYVFLRLRPETVQAWRESNEIAGRTIMRAGSWITPGGG